MGGRLAECQTTYNQVHSAMCRGLLLCRLQLFQPAATSAGV